MKKIDNDYSEKVINRLARIEGQVRGVRKMMEDKKGCVNVMRQLMAVREAINSTSIELLKDEFICRGVDKDMDGEYLKTLFKIK